MISLALHSVGHRYGYKRVFAGIAGLTLNSGDVLAVTGVNGSGKSTLLKILAGVLQPANGEIELRISDEVVPREQHSVHVGLVAPYVNVYEDLTLRENLTFITRARAMRPSFTKIRKIVSTVGLKDYIDDPVKTYSTGMQQRVRFAVALFHEPKILLLDEPTLGLDQSGRDIYEMIVTREQKAGNLVVIASNTQDDTELANRSLCIEDYGTRVAFLHGLEIL